MDWYALLKLTHIFGTVLGIGGSTLAEIFYVKFKKDGVMNPFEGSVLRTCYAVLRWGLALLVFSGFGYLVLWRLNFLGPEVFYNSRFLAKLTVVAVLLVVSFLMNFKKINLETGSSIATTSWYVAMILGIWRSLQAPYLVFILWYLIVLGATHFLLKYLRQKALQTL